MDQFQVELLSVMKKLRPHAYNLWPNTADREDGIQETICRALASRQQFTGGNLSGWVCRIMRHLKFDQNRKGYRRGKKGPPRLMFVGEYDYAHHVPTMDTPEAILMAIESVPIPVPKPPSKNAIYSKRYRERLKLRAA